MYLTLSHSFRDLLFCRIASNLCVFIEVLSQPTNLIPSPLTAPLGQVGIVMPTGTGNAGVTQFLLGVNDASYLDNRLACLRVDYRRSP